jgi:hypothetical protein
MDPIQSHIHTTDRIAGLVAEASAERLAAAQRRRHENEHRSHPALSHPHEAGGVRRAVGRLLIGLGSAIAGSGHGAGRPA